MKIYFYLCPIFFLCWGTSLKGQISAETETNLQLNTIDTIQAGDNVMIDKNGQLHFTTNGQSKQIESKNELSLSSKYLNYGVGYEGAFYYKHNNRVYLGGLVRAVTGSQTVDWFDLVGTLPKGYRPEKIDFVQATQNGNSIILIINPNGTIIVTTDGNGTSDYLSLEGINFYRADRLGDFVDGGYLFYIADPLEDLDGDGDLDRGLIAADVHTGASSWQCENIDINSDSTAIGFGYINSQLALDVCNFQSGPVKVCDDLVLNGYDDWFLPSHEELKLIWENLVDWNGSGNNDGNSIGDFSTSNYWSSSEAGFLTHHIRAVSMTNGYSGAVFPKDDFMSYRAVRVWD